MHISYNMSTCLHHIHLYPVESTVLMCNIQWDGSTFGGIQSQISGPEVFFYTNDDHQPWQGHLFKNIFAVDVFAVPAAPTIKDDLQESIWDEVLWMGFPKRIFLRDSSSIASIALPYRRRSASMLQKGSERYLFHFFLTHRSSDGKWTCLAETGQYQQVSKYITILYTVHRT